MNRPLRAFVVLLLVTGLVSPVVGACLCGEMARAADRHACCGAGEASRLTAAHDCCPEEGGAVAVPLLPVKALVAPAAVVPAAASARPAAQPMTALVPVSSSPSAPLILRI